MKIKKNGKVITLSESDLRRIAKRYINEGEDCLPKFAGESVLDKVKCCANKAGMSEKDLTNAKDIKELAQILMKKGGDFANCLFNVPNVFA